MGAYGSACFGEAPDVRVALLTVSDRASRGEREDQSGPVLRSMIENRGWEIAQREIVPDESDQIRQALMRWADEDLADLILTTGGTGLAPRDRTPEATRAVCDRLTPGLAEAMRAASLQITPHAMLSRAVAGVRERTLIVNLPGSPKAARENLQVILPVLPHAVELLRGREKADHGHHPPTAPHKA